MKILIVNKFLYRRGGAESYILDLAGELLKQGHEVQFFGMHDQHNEVGNRAGAYTSNVDFHEKRLSAVLYPFKIIYSIEARNKIRAVIEDFNPDIIHLNNINFQITPSIIDEIRKYGIPIVQTVHDFQMVCPNHLLFNPNTNKICSKCILHSKWNCTKNKCIHKSYLKSLIGSVEASLYNAKQTYAGIDAFICPSHFMENILLKDPIFHGKTTFLRNFSKECSSHQYDKKNYILYFGRLYEEKGIRNLVLAAKELKDIHFIVAGEGPLSYLCQDIPNLKFVGFKTGNELEQLIAEARLCVYPSIWLENCPLSIIEAQKLGTPVITSPIGGMKELVPKQLLTKSVTAQSLAESIASIYKDERLLQEMTIRSKEKALEYPSLPDYAEQIVAIYERNINKYVKSKRNRTCL